MNPALPLALTMGDPAGVGLEIAAKAWKEPGAVAPFFLIADLEAARAAASGVPVHAIDTPEEASAVFSEAMPVLHRPLTAQVIPGRPNAANAAATVASIDEAVALTQAGRAGAVVTNPINKKVLYDGAGFAHPGHTEYLAHLGGVPHTVMMLAAPGLRVVPVTVHIALAEVAAALTPALLEDTIRITHAAMIRDFGVAAPRIAVAGLNPHAGEGGAMGREDMEIIAPVLERLRAEGLDLRGPLPADTMFHPAARAGYDVAVTMYHDQGLIPIKTLDFARGVNVTLGLPFIRTSPDHGTAYDIAGQDRADPTSLIEAIRLAAQLVEARRR
ncbi:MAG: 4-hydroxythreonine-4-phosphate dehydrogenase PdxA [Pseudomonadota bacterium]